MITTQYIHTKEQPSDLLMKELPKVQHKHLKNKLGVINIFNTANLNGSVDVN
ncbi:hypothetical protein MTR67_013114 [Solanum verrucosum]|uniref:Uncharacterized protein n=1 Tax=Solanum verrucosum TaxID=315347 RepID=A0AAF0QGY8_SOLVR|nr:hypothetical protein MTR67_013114 [Solanum verrucosum]